MLQTPFKKPQEKTEEVQEANASLADAKGISVDSALATFLSGLDDILKKKKGEKQHCRLFSVDVFALHLTALARVRGALQLATGR